MQIVQSTYGGRWYSVYLQDWGADCGPTCVAMARHCLTGVGADIDWLRKQSRRPMISPGIAARIEALGQTSRDVGTYGPDLAQLARGLGLVAQFHQLGSFALNERLKTASRSKVFIVHVAWTAGGGHFVVVPHVNDAGSVIVLDPYYGLQVATMSPSYSFAGSGGTVSGRFSGDMIEISR